MESDWLDIDDFFNFYRSEFLPAYADLVAFLAVKPKQILTEIENTFSHIAQYSNTSLEKSIREDNLRKANDHLVRVTLDCYKLLWVQLKHELDNIYFDDTKRAFTLNISEDEFIKRYNEFRDKAREARNIELTSIGEGPLKSVEIYKETVNVGINLLKSVDHIKAQKFRKFRAIIATKECIIMLFIGIISGLLAGIILSKITI